MIVAIDGPAGSGKSTIAKLLAKKMKLIYIDSGAAYRAVSYYALKNNVSLNDENEIKLMLKNINLSYNENGEIILNGITLKDEIRTPEVAALVSKIARIKLVRTQVTNYLQDFAKLNSLIMDGRDIGTVVFPNADFKFFFVADPRVRALRRLKETNKEISEANIKIMEELILKRDEMDSTRSISPLQKANDALLIETSHLTIDQLVDNIYKILMEDIKNV